jgi:hypothetical protein
MRIILSVILAATLLSCNNDATKNAGDDTTRLRQIPADSSEADIVELNTEDFYIWKVNSEEKTIRKNPKLQHALLGVDTLIAGLNKIYPEIKLEMVRQGNDTLYTQIKEATYLTEQMGSAGAEGYIASAVINLSSAKGVKFVSIDFEMGSHAMPDVWSRKNFSDYKVIQ